MGCRIVDLRCKEVINICDGKRLGFPVDVDLEMPCGQILALVVLGPCRYWGLFGRAEEYIVPWACVRRIGDDLILIEHERPLHHGEHKREKRRFFDL